MDVNRTKEILKKYELDGCVLSSGENIFWASGFPPIPSVGNRGIFNQTRLQNAVFVVLPAEGDPTLIVSFGFYGIALSLSRISDIRCSGTTMYVDRSQSGQNPPVFAANPLEALFAVLKEKGLDQGRIGLETGFWPAVNKDKLKKANPNAKWVDCKEIILEAKMVKTPAEIAIMRKAVQANVHAIKKFIDATAEGVTEKELLDIYKLDLMKSGCDWGTTTLGAGGNSGEPYNIAGSYVLKKGDMLRVDLCPVFQGYFSDLARCVAIGEPPKEHRELFDTVYDAEARMVELVRPGVKMRELFAIGMETVQKKYPNFDRPNLGHNVGVFVHEEPDIAPNDVVLEPGMIIACEVPYYIPGVVGVNVENNVLVTENGYEVLDADLPNSLFIK